MIRIINSFLVFISLLSDVAFSQELRFLKEDINFKLNSEYFEVEGLYWFANLTNHSIEKVIFYPFGNTNKDEIIDSVEIINIMEGSINNVLNRNESGFNFLVKLENGDTTIYRIRYRQKLNCDSVRYILHSTQLWNEALESVEYKLIVSEPVVVTDYSYTPDETFSIQGKKIYYWKRSDFLPEKDLIFHFEIK